ncbi:uncharacterized protein LOC112053075 [Bicyclus anynana]|uniref:Uncharacterized protein LOC112053075 n=1 Tax=Bicyclus anynana TaxID=110368 RepID=A0A6J1NMH3_BICAN|nr:uncharacterized protein LOC112053075 [Bicyclus anynana]
MRRPILLLCLAARLSHELQAVQRYFAARRSSQLAAPSAYLYSRLGAGRTLGALHAREKRGGAQNATSLQHELMNVSTTSPERQESSNTSSDVPSLSVTARYSLWPASGAASNAMKGYGSVFRIDDEDLRADVKTSFYFWPLFYQTLYEFEPTSLGEAKKAIDKRFAMPTAGKIIPVHENVDETIDDDSGSNRNAIQDYKHTEAGATESPVNYDNKPLLYNGINDSFNKTNEDDSTTLKELPWEREMDHEMSSQDIEDSERLRRLQENNPSSNRKENTNTLVAHDGLDALQESVRNQGRNSYRESASNEKGDDNRHSYGGDYEYEGDNYRGFEDFVDSFANKYGLEEHDREAKFAKKNNADKGEKKKGFRTVYHKDEYQEHHDFFDNTDNNENVEEKGASKVHIGGSEGIVRSLAGAATGKDKSKLKNTENIERNQYERNQIDKEGLTDVEQELEQYRDVIKRMAQSDNAQYFDRYL